MHSNENLKIRQNTTSKNNTASRPKNIKNLKIIQGPKRGSEADSDDMDLERKFEFCSYL